MHIGYSVLIFSVFELLNHGQTGKYTKLMVNHLAFNYFQTDKLSNNQATCVYELLTLT